MEGLPLKIADSFERLKKEHPFRIVLKCINGKYYVYKERGIWLKDTHKTKIISEYLGRITDGGAYIKKKFTAKDNLENAKAIVEEHGGEIIWHEKTEENPLPVKQDLTATEIDLGLLTVLSMNSRLSAPKIAKIVGINEQAVYSRIKALEKKFGLKYILEVNLERLGYAPYLLLIKFRGNAPTTHELEKAFGSDPRIQFAATTKGNYDLIAYMLDTNAVQAIDNFRKLLSSTSLGRYGARWNLIPFATVYSFVPLRDEFIEIILKDKAWKRTRESMTPRENELMQREFLVLKELNGNSTMNFSEIDEKHDLDKGTSRYSYEQLKAQGIISRPTMTMTNMQIKYLGVISIANIYEKKVEQNRYKFLFEVMEYGNISNKYSLMGNIGMPDGGIMFMPVLSDGELDRTVMRVEKELQGSIVRGSVVTNALVGNLCYRRFDNDYSRQHKLLIDFGKLEPKKPADYE